eukprot:10935893-Alexandrium_andersonii.AAC.1
MTTAAPRSHGLCQFLAGCKCSCAAKKGHAMMARYGTVGDDGESDVGPGSLESVNHSELP